MEGSPFSGKALHLDRTAMACHNPVNNGQSQSRSDPRPFGSEKGIEDTVQKSGIDALARVLHRKPHVKSRLQSRMKRSEFLSEMDIGQAHIEDPPVVLHGMGRRWCKGS